MIKCLSFGRMFTFDFDLGGLTLVFAGTMTLDLCGILSYDNN